MKYMKIKYEYHHGSTVEQKFEDDVVNEIEFTTHGVVMPIGDNARRMIPWCRVFEIYEANLP